MFRESWLALGHSPPQLISYSQLPQQAPQVDFLRLDSPGENATLAHQLIRLGGASQQAQIQHGQVAYLKEFHMGYCQLLENIQSWQIPCFNAPAEIAQMFDKWRCHQLFQEASLARPRSRLAPLEYRQWRAQLAPQGRLFLKPLHGSSASGVCALRWTPQRVQMQSPLRVQSGLLFNSLKVQVYSSWTQVQTILEQLLPQAMIEEEWIPKLTLPQGAVDLRILVIGGQARHLVVRQSLSPMTNLHLGNLRGQPEEIQAHLPAARQLAQQAAACFPHCHYAGVDILLDPKGRPYIAEINAFGDLLPGLTHQGEEAYTAIARSYCESQSCPF